jgi:AcrR family transcriptional regulator
MARLLRVEQRLTVDQLAARLALPRSTVYYWVRDLPLSEREGESVGAGFGDRAGACVGERASAADGDAEYEDALRSFDDLDAQPTFRDFVCLYIARGCMRERMKVSLSDPDPAVMRLVNRWMLRLSDKSPLLSVRYEPGQSLTELRRFWSGIVGVQARAIRVHAETDRPGAPDLARRARHGVLTVSVEDALLRARLQAWICKTRDSWR